MKVARRGSEQFVLRFPDGMRDQLKTRAADEGRSMNSEIIRILAKALASQDKTATGPVLQANPAAESEQAALEGGALSQFDAENVDQFSPKLRNSSDEQPSK